MIKIKLTHKQAEALMGYLGEHLDINKVDELYQIYKMIVDMVYTTD